MGLFYGSTLKYDTRNPAEVGTSISGIFTIYTGNGVVSTQAGSSFSYTQATGDYIGVIFTPTDTTYTPSGVVKFVSDAGSESADMSCHKIAPITGTGTFVGYVYDGTSTLIGDEYVDGVIADAHVVMVVSRFPFETDDYVMYGQTDSEGKVTVSTVDIRSGMVFMTAFKSGYQVGNNQMAINGMIFNVKIPPIITIDSQLTYKSITSTFYKQDGSYITGETVRLSLIEDDGTGTNIPGSYSEDGGPLSLPPDDYNAIPVSILNTDVNGTVVFENLESGNYILDIIHDNTKPMYDYWWGKQSYLIKLLNSNLEYGFVGPEIFAVGWSTLDELSNELPDVGLKLVPVVETIQNVYRPDPLWPHPDPDWPPPDEDFEDYVPTEFLGISNSQGTGGTFVPNGDYTITTGRTHPGFLGIKDVRQT